MIAPSSAASMVVLPGSGRPFKNCPTASPRLIVLASQCLSSFASCSSVNLRLICFVFLSIATQLSSSC